MFSNYSLAGLLGRPTRFVELAVVFLVAPLAAGVVFVAPLTGRFVLLLAGLLAGVAAFFLLVAAGFALLLRPVADADFPMP